VILMYLVITAIVCVNMLIAMMGNKFNFLVEKQILKRQVSFSIGNIYFQTEKFLLPPPFNMLHLLYLGLTYPFWRKQKFQRWEPKAHNDAHSICMTLKEMYLYYRKEELEKLANGEIEEEDDDDDDDNAKLVKTNIKLHPFVSAFFKKRRPKEKEFLEHVLQQYLQKEAMTPAIPKHSKTLVPKTLATTESEEAVDLSVEEDYSEAEPESESDDEPESDK